MNPTLRIRQRGADGVKAEQPLRAGWSAASRGLRLGGAS
jgi:hypothetical protein